MSLGMYVQGNPNTQAIQTGAISLPQIHMGLGQGDLANLTAVNPAIVGPDGGPVGYWLVTVLDNSAIVAGQSAPSGVDTFTVNATTPLTVTEHLGARALTANENIAYNQTQGQAGYEAALEAGVVINSTGAPGLNGTYACNDAAQGKLASEELYILTKNTFTNGQTTRGWLDINGGVHTFPSTAEFTAFSQAVAQYVDSLIMAYATSQAGAAWVAPSNAISIP